MRFSTESLEEMISSKEIGNQGENKASLFLQKRGFFILQRNFHAGRGGEIDIVCRKENTIVFVEVKLRKSFRKGTPRESINSFKAKRMIFAAKCYLNMHHEFSDMNCRFDFIGISYNENTPEIDYIENILDSSEF
ncbi:MAG: YraN family protein [bacterium (Candidatus Stahlbacteria) CG23_combo_of_CG06-09_8_20_14_all_34_7]|nr:MAG: YraN family protein [bacterium (Candidatus Stahlbacteria) CG23_combo_of_CG06-09_8_20_14_all_34_7]